MLRWSAEQAVDLAIEAIGESYARYRLYQPDAERGMMRSLERYGQIAPVVVCRNGGQWELIDGFKRLGASRKLGSIPMLKARQIETDDRGAKAAIYGLNRAGGHTREIEEAWIVYALVREDGLAQTDVAELLGRHKSWVCRRLALIEKLGPEARTELQVGLLTPTAARQFVRLPAGNQAAVLSLVRREALSTAELTGIVDLWLESASVEAQQYLIDHPREALRQDGGIPQCGRDPRLSHAGNRIRQQLGGLLAALERMEVWLAHQGRAGLTPEDRTVLEPRFNKLSRSAASVAELSQNMIQEVTDVTRAS